MAKLGRSLQELAVEIERQANAKADFIAPVKQIEMGAVEGAVHLALGKAPIDTNGSSVKFLDQRKEFGLTNVAHGQLAEYADIPKAYYDRLLTQDPALLAKNVNRWLPADPKAKRLVRTLDGNVRGFLSDRYRSLDYIDLAEAVLPVISDMQLYVVSCEITERRLYIKAFDKRIEREILAKGTDAAHTFLKDVAFPAITITDSEVGFGSLSVAAGVYTGGCTNFASFSDSRMRKYHLGGKAIESSDVYALLSDATKVATDKAIWMQTRDVVKSAFEIAAFEERVARIQDTADQKITGDVVEVVEVAGKHLGLVQAERQSVLKHLIEGGNLSRYGLFNAVTRTAQDVASYDRATELEQLGAKVIELPRKEWERLAVAA